MRRKRRKWRRRRRGSFHVYQIMLDNAALKSMRTVAAYFPAAWVYLCFLNFHFEAEFNLCVWGFRCTRSVQ
jgi:hypothetical protein